MKTKQRYRAIWQNAGQPQRANVDFTAASDEDAIREADKIAVEVDSVNTARTIQRVPSGTLIENITTGVSK